MALKRLMTARPSMHRASLGTSLPVVKENNRSVLHPSKKRKNHRVGVPPPLAGGGEGVGVLASRDKPQIMDAHHQCFLRQRIGYFEKLRLLVISSGMALKRLMTARPSMHRASLGTSLPVVKENKRSVLHPLEKT
jgi:1,2-phenylacetyl-CoA epoxidase PaaB subunit